LGKTFQKNNEFPMQNKIVKLMLSPFLFCLTLGLLGIVAFQENLIKEIRNNPYQLILALLLGLIIGISVFVLEQTLYNHWRRKHNETSSYRGAWLWRAVLLLFISVVLLFDKAWKLPVESTNLVVFSGSVYLLTLSYVFFRIRNHPLFGFS
jgi:hypothetical protein